MVEFFPARFPNRFSDESHRLGLCDARSLADDPLAELARIVGGGETLQSTGAESKQDTLAQDLEAELFGSETAAAPLPDQSPVFDHNALEAALNSGAEDDRHLQMPAEAHEPAEAAGAQEADSDDPIMDLSFDEELASEVRSAVGDLQQPDPVMQKAPEPHDSLAESLFVAPIEEVQEAPEVLEPVHDHLQHPATDDRSTKASSDGTDEFEAELARLMDGGMSRGDGPASSSIDTSGEHQAFSGTPAAHAEAAVSPGPVMPRVPEPEIAPSDRPAVAKPASVVPVFNEEPVAVPPAATWTPSPLPDGSGHTSASVESRPPSGFDTDFASELEAALAADIAAQSGSGDIQPDRRGVAAGAIAGLAVSASSAARAPEGEAGPARSRSEVSLHSDFDEDDDDLMAPIAGARVAAANQRGSGKGVAAAILGVALLGGFGALAWNYMGDDSSGPATVVLASNDPVKVKPEDAGGAKVPNQDQAVYQKVGGDTPAKPAQKSLAKATEEPIRVSLETDAKAPKTGNRVEAGVAEKAAPQKTNSAPVQPRKVRTVVVKPDGTIITAATKPAVATAAAPVENAAAADQPGDTNAETNIEPTLTATSTPAKPAESAAEAEKTIAAKLAEPEADAKPVELKPEAVEPAAPAAQQPSAQKPAAPQPAAKKPAKPVAASKPVQVAKVEPKPEPAPAESTPAQGGYVVQVSSQRSAEAAQSSYNTLKRRYASLLDGKGVDIRRTNIEGKGIYYRVRVPAASKADAVQLCTKLKAAGGSCFVSR